jgi:hypothetical protein
LLKSLIHPLLKGSEFPERIDRVIPVGPKHSFFSPQFKS